MAIQLSLWSLNSFSVMFFLGVATIISFLVFSLEPVRVIGNVGQLGKWIITKSRKMKNEPRGSNQWVGHIKIRAPQLMEFKFLWVSLYLHSGLLSNRI